MRRAISSWSTFPTELRGDRAALARPPGGFTGSEFLWREETGREQESRRVRTPRTVQREPRRGMRVDWPRRWSDGSAPAFAGVLLKLGVGRT
jgi:hypothetical protein